MKIAANVSITADNTGLAKTEIKAAIKRALWRIGAAAEGYAKDLCPVDTGRLQASITHTEYEDAAYIGTNVEYGKYVELGTKRHRPQPFLKPAAEDHTDEYHSILQDELKK